MGSAWECQLWFDRAGVAYQGLGKFEHHLVEKLKSDFLQKFMAEEGVTEVIKRSRGGCWRGDYKGNIIWRVIKYLLVRDTEITVLGGFLFWTWIESVACWCGFGHDPAFWAGAWTALREEWDSFKHLWFCASVLGKRCWSRIWGALGVLEHCLTRN